MDNPTVFGIGNFDYANGLVRVGGDRASVEDLAATGGITRSIQNHGRTRAFFQFLDFSIEVVEKGITVVEAVGHGMGIILNTWGAEGHGGLVA